MSGQKPCLRQTTSFPATKTTEVHIPFVCVPVVLLFVVLQGKDDGPIIYIVAGVHGDEQAGWRAGNLLKEATIQAGLADALIGMKAGGSRKVIIPSWLMTYKRYDRPEDYINPPKSKKDKEVSSTGFSNTVYEITVNDFVKDIDAWEISNIGEYFAANPNLGLSVKDSLQYGFYYKQLKAPADTLDFKKDTTIYINYTGRLLNGLVFDTTDRKTGLDNGLSASRSYKPVAVKLSEEAKDITMGGSSIIEGFALTLKQMHAFEKGVGIFYSPLGYKYSGSGSSIPGYAPLIFEIEIVEKPEE